MEQKEIARKVLELIIKSTPPEELIIREVETPPDALFWAILGLMVEDKEETTNII